MVRLQIDRLKQAAGEKRPAQEPSVNKEAAEDVKALATRLDAIERALREMSDRLQELESRLPAKN